jgi:translation initiation factor IF-2
MTETEIGVITHFFDKIGVAAITMTDGSLSVGDTIHIKGHSTDMTVQVESMQIEKDKVQTATKGDAIGIKTGGKAREHDKVFKVTA